jgi:hypothetical protein
MWKNNEFSVMTMTVVIFWNPGELGHGERVPFRGIRDPIKSNVKNLIALGCQKTWP